ncbi:MAG: trimethylamine methyltransferase family protein, partial [Thermacetogeniaceae bacterium]
MPKSQYVRSSYKTYATPQFRVLSQDQCESIYLGALEVLQHTGAEVNSPEALEIYSKGGCWVDGRRVRFPSHLVEWAVRTTPSRITIYDRNGKRSMYLEGQNVYYGPGPTNTFTLDPFTGERRRPRKQDA